MLNVAFECLYYKQNDIILLILWSLSLTLALLSPNKHEHLMVLI